MKKFYKFRNIESRKIEKRKDEYKKKVISGQEFDIENQSLHFFLVKPMYDVI